MKRFAFVTFAFALIAAGCGNDSTPTNPSSAKPTFTADLRPANEVPPVTDDEATGSGTATITFDVTRDAAGNVTAGTATFVVTLTGFPSGTPINIAHIHQAPAGANGSIVFNTQLTAGEATLANGSGSFTKTAVSPQDLSQFNAIMNNPSGYYFNVHSTRHPAGVARGQLVRVQ
jgi:CHRD domain-containing protein